MRCVVCGAKHRARLARCGNCDLPFRQAGEPLPVIGDRYEVRSFLGRGGMGSVFAAWDRTLEEAVAIKVLRRDIEDIESMTRRFRSEIRLARKIRHPNVCGIHEYGEDDSTSYIAMELIEGENLKRVLERDGALSGSQVFDVALQLTAGLQAIHEAGVVHRDLKSSNAMLDNHGRLRLMDFGIAKQYGSEVAGITVAGQIVGTPEYMSPEQAQGEPLDFRSDIYAAGIILFEIFTGRVPFHAETPIATLYKQVQEPPPLDQPLARWLPDDVKDVLKRALAKHRSERYQSASELGEALRGLAARLGGASKGTPTVELRRPPRLPDPPSTPPPSSPKPPPPPDGPAVVEAGGAAARQPEPEPEPPPPTQAIPVTDPGARPPAPRPPAPLPHEPPTPTTPRRLGVALAAGGGLLGIVGVVATGAYLLRNPDDSPSAPPLPVDEARAVDPTLSPSTGDEDVSASTSPPGGSTERPPGEASPPAVTPDPPTPSPTPTATPTPTPTPVRPTPTPTPLPAPEPGSLQLRVRPWAEVEVDGRVIGTTPMAPLELEPGEHRVVLRHPDYEPVVRTKQVDAGESWELDLDLSLDAIAKQQ